MKGNRREDDLLSRIGDAERRTCLWVAPLHRFAGFVADPPEQTLRLVRRENEALVALTVPVTGRSSFIGSLARSVLLAVTSKVAGFGSLMPTLALALKLNPGAAASMAAC